MSIYFRKALVEEALKAVLESHELSEVGKDIDNILQQMEQVISSNLMQENNGNVRLWELQQARKLNDAMRKKYPIIVNMLNIAERLTPKGTSAETGSHTSETLEYILLEQDYYGILCHVLLKKKITETIEEFIEKVG